MVNRIKKIMIEILSKFKKSNWINKRKNRRRVNGASIEFPYSRRDWYYPPVSSSQTGGLISGWKGV